MKNNVSFRPLQLVTMRSRSCYTKLNQSIPWRFTRLCINNTDAISQPEKQPLKQALFLVHGRAGFGASPEPGSNPRGPKTDKISLRLLLPPVQNYQNDIWLYVFCED